MYKFPLSTRYNPSGYPTKKATAKGANHYRFGLNRAEQAMPDFAHVMSAAQGTWEDTLHEDGRVITAYRHPPTKSKGHSFGSKFKNPLT